MHRHSLSNNRDEKEPSLPPYLARGLPRRWCGYILWDCCEAFQPLVCLTLRLGWVPCCFRVSLPSNGPHSPGFQVRITWSPYSFVCSLLDLLKRSGRAATGVVPRSSAMAVTVPGGCVAALSATARFLGRQALNDSIAGKHASIDGKVTAHHKGTHGGVLLGKLVRLIGEVRLVLPTVDKNKACVASRITVTVVNWIRPSSTPAKALKVLHVETAHLGGGGGSSSSCSWTCRSNDENLTAEVRRGKRITRLDD